jgi:circadian clock protein KaiC
MRGFDIIIDESFFMVPKHSNIPQISSGISGLDELLHGGFIQGRMYLVSGEPGTGKTTFGIHFLQKGLEDDETVLFIHSEESAQEILENAAQFDIDITEAEFLDLGPDSDFFTDGPSYDLVDPGDVEGERYIQTIYEAIKTIDPTRVVLDPITQLQHVETSEHYYRKRLLSFMRFLKERNVTILATATTHDSERSDTEIRSISDGVIELPRGDGGRRIEVVKNRGFGQIDSDHGLEIRSEGIEVFPRVFAHPNDREFDPTSLRSGIAELDDLVGGGFERGTVTFISGPPGVGKTTTGAQYLTQAAVDGVKSVIYLIDERIETFTHRCRTLGIPVDEMRAEGLLTLNVIEPQTLSAEEFAHKVQHEVEQEGAEIVMIDSFGGYTSAIQGNQTDLKREFHTLTRYLLNNEVTVFVTDSIHQITGLSSATSVNISPIADNILFLSYVESNGSLRKVVGVLKKRTGGFEHTLRKFDITADGIQIGGPMAEFSGILNGVPEETPGSRRTGESTDGR